MQLSGLIDLPVSNAEPDVGEVGEVGVVPGAIVVGAATLDVPMMPFNVVVVAADGKVVTTRDFEMDASDVGEAEVETFPVNTLDVKPERARVCIESLELDDGSLTASSILKSRWAYSLITVRCETAANWSFTSIVKLQ